MYVMKGQEVYREGQLGKELYMVIRGELEVLQVTSSPRDNSS